VQEPGDEQYRGADGQRRADDGDGWLVPSLPPKRPEQQVHASSTVKRTEDEGWIAYHEEERFRPAQHSRVDRLAASGGRLEGCTSTYVSTRPSMR
jgi:hypothetical protein